MVAVVRQLSDFVQRAGLALKAGMTFGGKRDLFAVLGYKRELTPDDYRARYERNGIAARVVESLPQATWRGGAELIEDEDPDVSTDFEQIWEDLDKRLGIWSTFSKADVLAGLGQFSIILIGAPGKLETPLPSSMTAEQLIYLTPFAQDDVDIVSYVEDEADPRFGLPAAYMIKRLTSAKGSVRAKKVDASRVLHIADGVLDDRVFGTPRLSRVWNWLDDLEKVTGAGSESFWLRAHQGFHFDLDKDLVMSEPDVKKVQDAAEEFAHQLRRTIATRGMKMEAFGSDVANFNNQVDAIITLIAGATGIPKRILVGSERGELASTQDKTNWDERVSDRRQDFAEPSIVRPFVEMLQSVGVLPEVEEWNVRWPEMIQMDEAQRADIATKWADLNAKAGELVVKGSEIRDHVLGLEPLTDEDLAEFEADHQPVDEVPPDQPPADETQVDVVDPDAEDPETQPAAAARRVLASISKGRTAIKPSPERRIQKVADDARGRFAAIIEKATRKAGEILSTSALTNGLESRTESEVLKIADRAMEQFEHVLREQLMESLLDIVDSSGTSLSKIGIRVAQGKIRTAKDTVRTSFKKSNPRARQWAAQRSSRLVTDVTKTTREAIRKVIARSFEKQFTVGESARLIRNVVGLTERDAQAVLRLRETLAESPGQLVRAGNTRIRVPEDPSQDFLESKTEAYADRLLRARSETIARTETMAASNEGQRELWLQAQDEGLLPRNIVRKWIITDDDRLDEAICAEMEGETAELDEPFVLPDGTEVMGPPAHPNCRCTQGLAQGRD